MKTEKQKVAISENQILWRLKGLTANVESMVDILSNLGFDPKLIGDLIGIGYELATFSAEYNKERKEKLILRRKEGCEI